MPFLALRGGERVIPPQVEDGEPVCCRICNEEMSIVSSYVRQGGVFVARHFRHRTEGGSGGGRPDSTPDCPGESDAHLRMKSIAYSRLKHDFPEAKIELEGSVGSRRADVLLQFPSPRSPYGRGIAVEVQYRNIGKDIDAVERHYLENGFSVVWLEERHFTGRDVDLSGIRTVWPYAVPMVNGIEGYPETTRWLWQDKHAKVEREIPLPEEYWESHKQGDEWLPVVNRDLRRGGRAWATVTKTPTGALVFEVAKTTRSYGSGVESMKAQLSERDLEAMRRLVEVVDEKAFSGGRPRPRGSWETIASASFVGGPNTDSWLRSSFTPDAKVTLGLWKKTGAADPDYVSAQVDSKMISALAEVIELTEQAFKIEKTR